MKSNRVTTTGDIIRSLREEKRLPLRKIAALLDIDTSYYSKIERNEKKATKEQIRKLEIFFGVKKNSLLIPFLCEKIFFEISDEECADQVLRFAKEHIKFSRNQAKKL